MGSIPAKSFQAEGFCDERFLPLKQTFEHNFDEGLELGASVAVTLHGKPVVDLWGGYADREKSRPWQRDTIVNVFSTTKIPTAICIYMLIDQGLLDIDLPLQHYWPEFKGGGKEAITTRHVLLHSSGLPGLSQHVPTQDHVNWEKVISLIEAEPVWYEPGSKQTYHASTHGFLLGEVIRRISGQSPGQYLATRICSPLNIDFYIGVPVSEHERVSELFFEGERDEEEMTEMMARAMRTFEGTEHWSPEFISAESPASNGHGNARSIARLGTMIALGGELDGLRILSRETLEECTREHSNEYDEFIGDTVSRNLGMGRATFDFMMMTPDAFGWGGYGGSVCQMDLTREVAYAYAPNRLTPDIGMDLRNQALDVTLRKILESLE